MDGGQKRRLPSWMLGSGEVNQVREPKSGKKSNEHGMNQEIASQAPKPTSKARSRNLAKKALLQGQEMSVDAEGAPQVSMPRPKGRKCNLAKDAMLHEEEELLDMDSCVVRKCTRKKRKQISSEQDEDCDGEIHKATTKRKKDKAAKMVEHPVSQNTKKLERSMVRSEGDDMTSSSEDNEDLTVDDLMSIAKEYVKADGEKQAEQSRPACTSIGQSSLTSFSRNEAGAPSGAPESNNLPYLHEKAQSCDFLETSNGYTSVVPARTGDPSQDMLDLFLGPLLKKPVQEDNPIRYPSGVSKFSYESTRKNQGKVNGEEMIPLTKKKKTSLKDKFPMNVVLILTWLLRDHQVELQYGRYLFIAMDTFGASLCISTVVGSIIRTSLVHSVAVRTLKAPTSK